MSVQDTQDAPRAQGAEDAQQSKRLSNPAIATAVVFATVIFSVILAVFIIPMLVPKRKKSAAEGFVGVPAVAAAPPVPAGGAAAPMQAVGGAAPMQAAAVRAHRRNAALRNFEISEAEALNGPSSLLAAVVRRSPNTFNGTAPGTQIADIDSDFALVGAFKESLTSNRPLAPNTITGHGSGLGDIRADPRFEPVGGRVASGDASPSHGGHAGGVTLGGFGSSKFQRSGWSRSYVHGFGA